MDTIADHSSFQLQSPALLTQRTTGERPSAACVTAKRCNRCGELKRIRDFYHERSRWTGKRNRAGMCKDCRKATDVVRYAARQADGTCLRCGEPRDLPGRSCSECLRKIRARYAKAADAVYAHYGDACVCCGERDRNFLTLDHVNNDGAQQRRAGFRGELHRLWALAKRVGWPSDLQVLCGNCQLGKLRNRGTCPHRAMA